MIKTMLFAAIGLLLAGAAWTARPGPESMDTDGDGSISLAEFENAHLERAREHFARLDADGDGMLAADELQRPARDWNRSLRRDRRSPERSFERLDADASGGISLAELGNARSAPNAADFATVDVDGSGELDADEFGAMLRMRMQKRRTRSQ